MGRVQEIPVFSGDRDSVVVLQNNYTPNFSYVQPLFSKAMAPFSYGCLLDNLFWF